MHGGKSPQALAKAEERLRALEFPAIAAVGALIEHADSDAVRLAAARWALELLGHKAAVQVHSESETIIRLIRDDPAPLILEQRDDDE